MTTLSAGSRLGPYRILEPIGAGGMGEVYKASDTRLDRVVAIKVLPRHWAANDEMRQRFEREAQTLASLNHPHICVLHDIGKQDGADFLVMEYLEGETLAARLERGPLALNEAMKLGMEIANALDKAHRKGVVHRDLKPSNVMLTKSGTKLLDFGLAKFAVQNNSSSVTNSPTVLPTGKDLTTPGTVLGTLQYMAPEQLEGLEVDARTDIFSFGALLHEMVTGKKAFEGKSRVLLIAAIATSDPVPLSSVEPMATPALEHLVKTCVAKEPADRWQTARDLLAELEWIAEGGVEGMVVAPIAPSSRRSRWLKRAALAGAGILAGAATTSASMYLRGPALADEFRMRVPIQLTSETAVAGGRGGNPGAAQGFGGVSGGGVFNPAHFAISPNGRMIAFVARQQQQDPLFLYVRQIGSVTPQRIPQTENATLPFWSPDSSSIGFVAGGSLKKVSIMGGPPEEICKVASFNGGTWNSDGIILFGTPTGLQSVPAEGGTPEAITHPADSETGHFWPHFLPDGRHYLYTAWSGQTANRSIMAGELRSSEKPTRVLPVASNAAYAAPGYLVFHRESAVFAQPFDTRSIRASGDAARIADEVSYETATGQGHFSVAANGAMAYFYSGSGNALQVGSSSDLSEWQLSWAERSGQPGAAVGPPGAYRGVEVSPDTTRVAVHVHDTNGGDIKVLEPSGSVLRLTFNAAQHNSSPIWSPDGSHIAFASLRNGKWGLYQTLSTRSGSEEPLYESDLPVAPMSWYGKYLVFWVQDPKNAGDIWVLTLDDKKAAKLIATDANEIHPQISPDGKWIAYTDNSKDNRNEIYVQPFPSLGAVYQVSNAGGDWPRWRTSQELVFHAIGPNQTPSTNAGAVAFNGPSYSVTMAVKGSTLEFKLPRPLLIFPALNLVHTGGSYHTYGVDPKSERLLVMQYFASSTALTQIGPDTPSGLSVVLNWASGLKK